MTSQLPLLAPYGSETPGIGVTPGDEIRAFGGRRFTVTHLSDDVSGAPIYVAIAHDTGLDAAILSREVELHFVRGGNSR